MVMSRLRAVSVFVLIAGCVTFCPGCQTGPINNDGGDGMNGGDGGNGGDGMNGGDGGGQTSAGKTAYDTNCLRCHAEPGAGTGNAPDIAGASADFITGKFNESLHQDLFPNFAQQSLNDIAAYLATF